MVSYYNALFSRLRRELGEPSYRDNRFAVFVVQR